MTDELALIDAAKAGSADAFAGLVRSYRDRLLRFLLTRCASYAAAEDALQDTLINAYRYLKSYDPRWRFSTWLYRIAIRNSSARRVLTDDAFAAMWLRYVEDMSINDISKALDRSASWTKVNLSRARKALDTEMNSQSAKDEAYG